MSGNGKNGKSGNGGDRSVSNHVTVSVSVNGRDQPVVAGPLTREGKARERSYRGRSDCAPQHSLPECIALVKKLGLDGRDASYGEMAKLGIPGVEDAEGLRPIRSAERFGLLEIFDRGPERRVKMTSLGMRCIVKLDPDAEMAARREAFRTVDLYARMEAGFDGLMTERRGMYGKLAEYGVLETKRALRAAARGLIASAEYADVLEDGRFKRPIAGTPAAPAPEPEPVPGPVPAHPPASAAAEPARETAPIPAKGPSDPLDDLVGALAPRTRHDKYTSILADMVPSDIGDVTDEQIERYGRVARALRDDARRP